VVLTNGFLNRLNALELDLKIFEGPKAWITENSVACMQLAAGFVVASALHNRKRTRRMTAGGDYTGVTAGTTVMPAIRRCHYPDASSNHAADNDFGMFTNGRGH